MPGASIMHQGLCHFMATGIAQMQTRLAEKKPMIIFILFQKLFFVQ